MNIDRITYRKTFNLGMFQSESIGVEIELSTPNEDPLEALRTAKKLVEEYHQESSPDEFRGTQERIIETAETIKENEDKIKEEYVSIEAKLNSFEFMEDAQEYLNSTGFRYYLPAKAIINLKPSKNK